MFVTWKIKIIFYIFKKGMIFKVQFLNFPDITMFITISRGWLSFPFSILPDFLFSPDKMKVYAHWWVVWTAHSKSTSAFKDCSSKRPDRISRLLGKTRSNSVLVRERKKKIIFYLPKFCCYILLDKWQQQNRDCSINRAVCESNLVHTLRESSEQPATTLKTLHL